MNALAKVELLWLASLAVACLVEVDQISWSEIHVLHVSALLRDLCGAAQQPVRDNVGHQRPPSRDPPEGRQHPRCHRRLWLFGLIFQGREITKFSVFTISKLSLHDSTDTACARSTALFLMRAHGRGAVVTASLLRPRRKGWLSPAEVYIVAIFFLRVGPHLKSLHILQSRYIFATRP